VKELGMKFPQSFILINKGLNVELVNPLNICCCRRTFVTFLQELSQRSNGRGILGRFLGKRFSKFEVH
jgi:hypothetical protein